MSQYFLLAKSHKNVSNSHFLPENMRFYRIKPLLLQNMKEMFFSMMPMFVCLFWSVILASELIINGKSRPKGHLLAFMMTATILYMGHWAFFHHSTHILPATDTLYSVANLAVYPLFYLYICSLTERKKERRLQYIMLCPAIVLGVMVGVLYGMMTQEETTQFFDLYLYEGTHNGLTGLAIQQAAMHDVCKVMFVLLLISVFVRGRSHLKRYERLVNSTYADTEDKSMKGIHYLLVVFMVTSVFSIVFSIIGRHHFADSIWLLAIPSTLFSVLLFAIGMIGNRQAFGIEDIEEDEKQTDEVVNEQPVIKELRVKIEQLMEEEQLFRQPNLKIVDLVKRLGTNRNYVYNAINREMGVSFTEYVNRMRVDYAAQLMAQHPNMVLAEVCEQSGFTSSASFFRNFRQFKGVGPREYQNKLKP